MYAILPLPNDPTGAAVPGAPPDFPLPADAPAAAFRAIFLNLGPHVTDGRAGTSLDMRIDDPDRSAEIGPDPALVWLCPAGCVPALPVPSPQTDRPLPFESDASRAALEVAVPVAPDQPRQATGSGAPVRDTRISPVSLGTGDGAVKGDGGATPDLSPLDMRAPIRTERLLPGLNPPAGAVAQAPAAVPRTGPSVPREVVDARAGGKTPSADVAGTLTFPPMDAAPEISTGHKMTAESDRTRQNLAAPPLSGQERGGAGGSGADTMLPETTLTRAAKGPSAPKVPDLPLLVPKAMPLAAQGAMAAVSVSGFAQPDAVEHVSTPPTQGVSAADPPGDPSGRATPAALTPSSVPALPTVPPTSSRIVGRLDPDDGLDRIWPIASPAAPEQGAVMTGETRPDLRIGAAGARPVSVTAVVPEWPEPVAPVQTQLEFAAQGAAELAPPAETASTSRSPESLSSIPSAPPKPASFATQIAHVIRSDEGGPGDQPVDITLDPPELGRVRLSLSEVNGALTLAISAERPETADMMRRHLALLLDEFMRSGLDVPTVSIFERGSDAQKGQGGARTFPDGHGRPDGSGEDPSVARPSPQPTAGGLDLRL